MNSDRIDLDALFDFLVTDPADRAADVTLTQVDADTVELTIDGQADFSITVQNVIVADLEFGDEIVIT